MIKKTQVFCISWFMASFVNAQYPEQQLIKLKTAFLAHPENYKNYESLSFLVSQHYLALTNKERKQVRTLLAEYSKFSNIRIHPQGERGTPITIHGVVTNDRGVALKNVQLLIFHTDASGYYAPDDSIKQTMNEPDARLFGYITTNDFGQYSFTTIHPGTYPKKYQGRHIPQHIHFEIKYPGYQNFSIQMAFEDDPVMKDLYWKKWATELGFPVIRFLKENGQTTGIYNIRLSKK